MGRYSKFIDLAFFDQDSKAKWYVMGSFFPCCDLKGDNGFIFRSKHKDLVEIVKHQLDSDHAIISDPRKKHNMHRIEAYGYPYLNKVLRDYGLGVKKKEREFPDDISDTNLPYFIRGFLDAKARFDMNFHELDLKFSPLFIDKLATSIKENAKVDCVVNDQGWISYTGENIKVIFDYVYSDLGYTKRHKLYLSSQRNDFQRLVQLSTI